MRKVYIALSCIAIAATTILMLHHQKDPHLIYASKASEDENEEEMDGYDGPAQRDSFEFERIKDPSLGYVPNERLISAIDYTERLKQSQSVARLQRSYLWTERGPIYDSVGTSGNSRGGGGYTAGRIAAVLVDTLNDATGNTVFAGGVAGGLWRCTNFLSPIPNWQLISDYFDNLAISSICQNPADPNIMYFSTGEATSNVDAVYGAGIWKSTDKGLTWSRLSSTVTFIRSFKMLCDNAGNVYLAARTTGSPAQQLNGLMRSTDGGGTWTNITPTAVGTATSTASCTDIEISSAGRFHASFGYNTGSPGTTVRHFYTDDPKTVVPATGWKQSAGIRTATGAPAADRLELASSGTTLYAVTTSTANNIDSCYKSVDNGTTWTKQNSAAFPTGVLNGQGWYNIVLAINPDNAAQFIVGGLDAYLSTNNGVSVQTPPLTNWAGNIPYVHADHHFIQWWKSNGESRVLLGTDGGLFLSKDGGISWIDRNRNLAIKQFYGCAIHPDAGSPYLIAGAQDNGCHQLRNAGLSYSTEFYGGDGCYVHINQQNPNIQFGSYVYNTFRRSTDGGATWTSLSYSTSAGQFVNPYTIDDGIDMLYSCWTSNNILRWPNASTSTSANLLTITGLGTASTFTVSPYTARRLYVGNTAGKLLRIDNANTISTASEVTSNTKDITGSGFPAANLSCVNMGTTDQTLVAVFSNYGVKHIWYSTDGGTTWASIDGNLPDMPVRWAVFEPGSDTKILLATEAGVYSTDAVNGTSTNWLPNPGFPTVRTDMLRVRTSDNTIVAATHGRGLFTATIPSNSNPEINFATTSLNVNEITEGGKDCRGYKDYMVNVGIVNPPTGNATVTYNVKAGNTATKSIDFDFTTNGDFSTPSDKHIFNSGVAGVQPITIRVYDDAEVESTEALTIEFTVGAGTNAVAGSAKTLNIIISDNDNLPAAAGSTLNASIGVNNISSTQPFRGQFSDSRTQMVYLASELQAAGLKAGSITSLAFNVISKNSTAPYNNFTIKLKNTNSYTLNGSNFEGGAGIVYGPVNYSTVAGTNTFTLASSFVWDGVSNILVDICYDNTVGTATDNVAGTGGIARCMFDRINNDVGCSLTTGNFTFTGGGRPDISFVMTTLKNPVASSVGNSKSEYLNSGNDIYYYTSTGDIMAHIHNLSNTDFGCTKVAIDRAGSNSTQFWNNNFANYAADKTFQIIPSSTTNGKYEITLYYSEAEKAGWERATGKSWNDIQLISLPSAIKNVTPLNAQPDGPGTIQVVTPIRGRYGNDYTLTYTFDNSKLKSAFGAGIPGRMNTILTLSGVLSGQLINLNWTASAEINSTVFEVEKSYDGINFHKIGTVSAAGNKLTPSTYASVDNENVQTNYFRIKMLHSDGYVLYSNTIFINNDNAPQRLIVYPSPFTTNLSIRFARPVHQMIIITLYDLNGKAIQKWSEYNFTGVLQKDLNTSFMLATGYYILDVWAVGADGPHYRAKILKQ